MSDKVKSLAARLLDVRRSVKWVQKDGKNAHQGFRYVSSSGVLGSIKAAMDSEGVLLIPSVVLAERSERTTKSGATELLTELRMEYRIINADDSTDIMTVGWYGQGLDTGEKGVGKALTYAEKYFILKLFNIPTDDADPDADTHTRAAAASISQPRDVGHIAPAREPERLVPPPTVPVQSGPRPAETANPNAITDAQRRKIFAKVKEIFGGAAPDDEVRANCTALAQRMCQTTVSGLSKKQASGVIEFLETATIETLNDDISF